MPATKNSYLKLDANQLTAADFDRIIPRRLYKYRAANDFFFNMLQTGTLWFSRPADFNDPFDCRLKLNFGKDPVQLAANLQQAGLLPVFQTKSLNQKHRQMMSDPAWYNMLMTMMHHYVVNKRLSVCCFTEDPKNLLMWAHYAGSHSGVCLEMDIDRNDSLYPNLLPVQYKQRYPVFNISRFNGQPRIFYTMHQHAVCTKSRHWEYEREWRAVLDEKAGAKTFNKKHLRRIIFGVNTPVKIITQTKRALKQYGYTHTSLARCMMKENGFGLNLAPLS